MSEFSNGTRKILRNNYRKNKEGVKKNNAKIPSLNMQKNSNGYGGRDIENQPFKA
jgi:hypothetical protein